MERYGSKTSEGMIGVLSGAIARSTVYGLLARAFLTEPTPSFLLGLSEPNTLRILAKVGGQWMASLPDFDPGALADELATEYARLFVGPGYHLYPYESMHIAGNDAEWEGPDAHLYGKPAIAVSEVYRQAGIVPSPSFHGLPDHLGVELEYMSHLSSREARCWEKEDAGGATSALALQQNFLHRHLVPWVPRFARRVRRFGAHPFYCSMASAASRFVQIDLRTVDELLSNQQVRDEGPGELNQVTTSTRAHRRH
ncbi:MAG: molecular chaperone TorD family protein [Dehalococcoidia bacterium]|nr:molecular chaperone TorD family protein [Dehalococcoidia bacterium]